MASTDTAASPYITYRRDLDLYQRALSAGLTDDAYVGLVVAADERVVAVEGVGFRVTPLVDLDLRRPGAPAVVAKVETGNVSGSHKARHLFGLLLELLIEGSSSERLAIASCGNAALGAAVVARAAERPLDVFVPVDADPNIVARLNELAANVVTCPRQPGVDGDPCFHALQRAVAAGAEPFTVQSPMSPTVVDGARTIGLELAAQLDGRSVEPASIYIQIGGGALATAVMDGLARAWPGRALPRLHPVQALTAHPYVAGWRRIEPLLDAGRPLAEAIEAHAELMTPWPSPPSSVASGILDDVTYDWRTVMAHQIRTGGWPLVVPEPTFVAARELAADQVGPSPPPDETGAAGLAGLLHHLDTDPATVAGPAVVLLTGAVR